MGSRVTDPNQRARSFRVVVVGGGVTGLAAAHRLTELSRGAGRPLELTLFEASGRLGGIISTQRRDGFLIEGGSDSFITTKPAGVELCHRLGLEDQLIPTDPAHRRAYVVFRGRLHPMPEGFLLLAPAKIWPVVTSRLFSWRGKMRMALDLVLPRGPQQPDESVAAFVTRRLGKEVLDRLVQPLVGGIYTADPKNLSLRATFPRFLDMEQEHRSLILASRRRARSDTAEGEGTSGARFSLFVTLESGLETLIDHLADRLPEGTVRLNSAVAEITPSEAASTDDTRSSWQIELEDGTRDTANVVLLATPAFQTAAMMKKLDRELAGELEKIQYASSALVNVAYRRADVEHPLDGFGFVVPAAEGRSIIGCSFSSVKFPVRASGDEVLFRVFLGGAMQPEILDLEDDELKAEVRKELAELIGAHGEPLFIEAARHGRSMPQYEVGHLQRVAEIERLAQQHPGLQLAGNAYHGVGIPDCIASGERAAEAIWDTIVSQST